METPHEKKPSPNSGEIDASRRAFLFGRSGENAEKRGESEGRKLSETCSQVSRVDDRSKTGADEESEADLARRKFINTASAALAVGLVSGKTGYIIGDFINKQGGLEAIQAKAARIQEGVTGGRLAEYVAERQREGLHREKLERLRDEAKEMFQKTYHIPLVFEENPHHSRPEYGRFHHRRHISCHNFRPLKCLLLSLCITQIF